MHSYAALESIASQHSASLAAEAELRRLGRTARRHTRRAGQLRWFHLPREPLPARA
jgi:hypothetical protein